MARSHAFVFARARLRVHVLGMGGVRVSVEGEGVGPIELCIFKICWRSQIPYPTFNLVAICTMPLFLCERTFRLNV